MNEAQWTQFVVGMRVRHVEFGDGKIMEKSGVGDALKVMVLFDSGQWKKLLSEIRRPRPDSKSIRV